MEIIKGLKGETVEKLADLWIDKNFQELVKIMRLNQENFGKMCLIRNRWEDVQQLQWYAVAFSLVIKTVEGCYKKLNGDKKNVRSSK